MRQAGTSFHEAGVSWTHGNIYNTQGTSDRITLHQPVQSKGRWPHCRGRSSKRAIAPFRELGLGNSSAMKIALCTAHPFPPQIAGGAQASMIELAHALQQRGHTVAVLCGLTTTGALGALARIKLKLGRRKIAADEYCDIPVYRAWNPRETVREFVDRFDPEVAVCFSGFPVPLATELQAHGVPSIIYFRNVEENDFGGHPGVAAHHIANSHFTADRIRSLFGISSVVIPPLFDRSRYETRTSREFVTFINPHPLKGRDIAFDLIRSCSDIPFQVVRAWTLDKDEEEKLCLLESECSNVVVVSRTNDMRSIYSRTRILLAPSFWEEAWGRVATEAHYSGIPVIATDIGGLGEAVGDGGILLNRRATSQEWKEALVGLWRDDRRYEELSQQALEYAARPEINSEQQISLLEEQLYRAVPNRLVARAAYAGSAAFNNRYLAVPPRCE